MASSGMFREALRREIILEALDQLPHFHFEFLGQIHNPGLAHISNLTPDTGFALGAVAQSR